MKRYQLCVSWHTTHMPVSPFVTKSQPSRELQEERAASSPISVCINVSAKITPRYENATQNDNTVIKIEQMKKQWAAQVSM